MRGLKQFRSVRIISIGHAFIQNIRRGHYELAPTLILDIGSRLRSPSWRTPSDPGATDGDAWLLLAKATVPPMTNPSGSCQRIR
jgi:hypothetical protein